MDRDGYRRHPSDRGFRYHPGQRRSLYTTPFPTHEFYRFGTSGRGGLHRGFAPRTGRGR
jgi:hypothetical protein